MKARELGTANSGSNPTKGEPRRSARRTGGNPTEFVFWNAPRSSSKSRDRAATCALNRFLRTTRPAANPTSEGPETFLDGNPRSVFVKALSLPGLFPRLPEYPKRGPAAHRSALAKTHSRSWNGTASGQGHPRPEPLSVLSVEPDVSIALCGRVLVMEPMNYWRAEQRQGRRFAGASTL